MQRLTVSDAARELGISVQAIHGRINRGTIEHERVDDRIYVFLPEEETHDQHSDNIVVNKVYNSYITTLKSEIESLRHDREVWIEEAKRKDTIIAQMNQTMGSLIHRIPELEAPSTDSGQAPSETTPEATEAPVADSNTQSRGVVPPGAQKGFWRRIFG